MSDHRINCIVIDDEVASQKVLKHFIEETEVLHLKQIFSNPKDAYKYLQLNSSVDLIFLDINMPEQHGLDFYKSLYPAPPVIFTTAYPQYAIEGFEVNAIDYLLKPIPYERFLKAIRKVIDQLTHETVDASFLSIKENKTIHKVDFKSIIYVEASGDYVKVITDHHTIVTHSTFSNFIKQLPNYFIRIHKSFCINKEHLSKLSGNQIQVSKYVLPVGQTYKSQVLESLNL